MKFMDAGLVLCLVAATVTSAHAAGPSALELQREHFRRAQAAYRTGHFKEALAEYEAALKAKHHPVIVFNIAQCHRQLRHYDKALFFYKLYLSELPRAKNRALVERLIEKMRKLARDFGRLSVVTTPPGASVFLDNPKGRPLGKSPLLAKVRGGWHVVYVTLPGYEQEQRVVSVSRGKVAALTLELKQRKSRPLSSSGKVVVRSQPPGAQVRVDDPTAKPVGVTPVTLDLPVGRHLLFVGKNGYGVARRVVTVASGQTNEVQVVLSPLGDSYMVIMELGPNSYAVRVVARRKRHVTTLARWTWGLAMTALLLSSVPLTTGVLALSAHMRWKETSDPEMAKKAHRYAVATEAMSGVVGALGVAALVTGILDRKRRKHKKRPKAWVAPSCGSTGCGVMVGGVF